MSALAGDLTEKALGLGTRLLLDHVAPRLDQRMSFSTRPFDEPTLMRPHAESRRWAWTHYGVFLPRLPEPYRFLNTMTFIGATGTRCFDNDYLAMPDARDTATVLSTTATGPHHHYQAYDSQRDCGFREDGTVLSWGEHLTITARHPRYEARGRYEHLAVELEVVATNHASWFVRTPPYDHLSLLATVTGTITDERGTTSISDLCTVEYARCMSPQALTARPLPEAAKLPVDFFTYQIVNLDERTQLLLTDVQAAGSTACRLAHLRSLDAPAEVYDDVAFEVLEHRAAPAVDPLGRKMRIPELMRWTVRSLDAGEIVGHFVARVDSEPRYGHGRGYVAACTYEGEWRGRPITTTGYLEWIDCRPGPPTA
ncbi:hypothetical protein HT102_01540 [Hoyosella sp. G463]|uniref:Uncharacterized protein n=1 Tax=Lolliginicoccus lacisalsi TaxID=2742202 RepID=A0A927PK10_9ACTN|nr:DUF6670 family protein [Lolliginicoccus lacisalsi]MBD8505173.1 hypothetical protein [Lolliginicoccus lacisalsi]